jgi:hypothetical protein
MAIGSFSVTLMAPLLSLLAAFAPGAGQDDGPEELAKLAMANIKVGVKDYRPAAIEEGLRDLDMVYLKVSAKTLKKIGKSVTSVFKLKPKRPSEENEDTREDLIEAYWIAIGLVYDKPEGPALFHAALKQKHIADWWEVRAAIIEGLGYAKDPGELAFFKKELNVKNYLVASSAARSLGQYSEEPLPIRRKAVRSIIDSWLQYTKDAKKEVDRKKKTTAAQDALADVEGPFGQTLTLLTRKDYLDAQAWDNWFKEHGSETNW